MTSVGLSDLPNCILLLLMSYLDATSLYCLTRVSNHFDALARKHKILWRWIDARRAPNTQDKIDYCVERMHAAFTKAALFQGMPLGLDFYDKINEKCYMNLSIVAIEHQIIHASRYSIRTFPKWLVELSLKGSVVENSVEFFRNSDNHMTELRVLILDRCDWFPTSALMALSKYPKLEILSLCKSKNVENSIPYLSISGRFGFKHLRILDIRLSALGNTLIHCFSRSTSLLAIYLQNEDITYKLDYYKRQLDIMNGTRALNFDCNQPEYDVSDSLRNELNGTTREDISSLDDKGLMDYFDIHSDYKIISSPVSYLYVDPYNKCRCKGVDHFHRNTGKRKPPDDSSSDDSDGDDRTDTVRQLGRNIKILNRIIGKTKREGGIGRGLDTGTKTPPTNFVSTIAQRDANGDPRVIILHPHNTAEHDREESSGVRIHFYASNNGNSNREAREEPAPKRRRIEGQQQQEEEEAGPSRRRHAVGPQLGGFFRMIYMDETKKKQIKIPLRRLSLRGYRKITDAGLSYLNNLELELLDLTYTSVTKQAIDYYLIHHPNCRIVHEDFCICPTNL